VLVSTSNFACLALVQNVYYQVNFTDTAPTIVIDAPILILA
jgi:hypothetical protein